MTLTPGTPLTAEAAMSEVQVLLASLNDADDEYRIQESDDFPLGVVRALTARIAELEAERAKDREALERIDRNKNASGDQIEVIKRIARARLSTPAPVAAEPDRDLDGEQTPATTELSKNLGELDGAVERVRAEGHCRSRLFVRRDRPRNLRPDH